MSSAQEHLSVTHFSSEGQNGECSKRGGGQLECWLHPRPGGRVRCVETNPDGGSKGNTFIPHLEVPPTVLRISEGAFPLRWLSYFICSGRAQETEAP